MNTNNRPNNTRNDLLPLSELLHSACRRYLNVRPRGFVLNSGDAPRACIEARIIAYGGARTLYSQRKPQCRSLDGVHPIDDSTRLCRDCRAKPHCTTQLRLDLFVDAQPFRLLLAYTSAKAFLIYHDKLCKRGIAYGEVIHRIEVIDRGSWGELRFALTTS